MSTDSKTEKLNLREALLTANRGAKLHPIIEVCTELFRERGYCYTSMSEIAKTCGISKANVYHYVDTKLDLAILCVQKLRREAKLGVLAVPYDSWIPKEERLPAFLAAIEKHFSIIKGNCLVTRLSLEMSHVESELSAEIEKYFNNWQSAFQYALKDNRTPSEAKKLAIKMMCIIEGVIMMGYISPKAVCFANFAEKFAEILGVSKTY